MSIYEVTDLNSGKVEYVSSVQAGDLSDYYSETKIVSLDPSGDIQVVYYKESIYHRLDGPAIVYANGTEYWYFEGKVHRLDGPAIIYANSVKHWYQEGKLHRLDGPAIVGADGTKKWYVDGKRHRLDGPAIVYAKGIKYWYIEGDNYSEEEFNEYLRSH